MNTDHPDVSAFRVMRLALITVLFAIACGLPDSLGTVVGVIQALIAS